MFEMKKIALSVKAVLLLSLPLAANAGVKVVNGTFNPSVGGEQTELLEDLIVYVKNPSVSPSPIVFNGNSDSTPVKFDFKGNVTVDVSHDSPSSAWSAYGVLANSSANGKVDLAFHKALTVNIINTTNIGVGLCSGTLWPNGNDNGTTFALNGPSTVNVRGNSVLGAVAGSMFGNNSNPGGSLIFGSGNKHVINVTSDWTGGANTSKDEDWAVGLLSYDKGMVDIQGDMDVSVNVKGMQITNHSGVVEEWGDSAAGVYVDRGSSLKTGTRLNIAVNADGQDIAGNNQVPIHGLIVGQHEAAQGYSGQHSTVTLNGTTNVEIGVASANNRNSNYCGISVLGGSVLNANDMVAIIPSFGHGIDFSTTENINLYGVVAGTYLPGSTLRSHTSNSGSAGFWNGLIITAPSGVNPALNRLIAIYSNNTGWIGSVDGVSVDNTSTGALVQIDGQIKTENYGVVRLSLSGRDSYLSSFIKSDDYGRMDGYVYVNLSNGATWNVLENVAREVDDWWDNDSRSYVYNVNLSSGGAINLSRPERYSNLFQDSDYQSVEIFRNLSGSDGRMIFDLDLANEDHHKVFTDQIVVDGTVSGSHIVDINFIGGGSSIGNKATDYSINWLISQNAGSMTLTNERGNNLYIGSGMLNYWALVFVPDGGFDSLNDEAYRAGLTNVGNGKGCWHLIKTNSIPLTPLLPPEVIENVNMGTSSGQALTYLADLEDLRKRLGEVRYGAQDGGWVKVFTKKDSVNTSGAAGFQQETNGFNIGVDRLVKADETQAWLLGGAFRYSKSDQDGLGVKSSTGKLYEYSLKSYATWMSDNGSYADLVAQIGRYEQKLDGLNNTGTASSHASYNTVGYGLSAELGHMFSFGDSVDDRHWYNHFFVEPQIQLSYFHVKGQDYTTSTGLSVSQGNANFLTGRAGLVLGKKFNYGTVDDLDRRFFQVGLLGGVKHEFLGGDQTISYTGVDGGKASVRAGDIAGTRFYYGVNFDWQMTENFRLYAQVNREEGDHYTKDFDVSIGGKLLF
jgi:outer membrane autotransporter protein